MPEKYTATFTFFNEEDIGLFAEWWDQEGRDSFIDDQCARYDLEFKKHEEVEVFENKT